MSIGGAVSMGSMQAISSGPDRTHARCAVLQGCRRFTDRSDQAHFNSRLAELCKSLISGRAPRVGAS